MLNDLTKRLYAEGWTRDHHPNTVYWKDFENFGYRFETLLQTTWETGCGLFVEGRTISTSDVCYDDVQYCPENNNPLIRCPYGRRDCPHQPAELNRYSMCLCRETDKAYSYDQSAEKVEEERDRQRREKYMEITGGQYCFCLSNTNGFAGGRVKVEYDPETCIRLGCKNPVCSVTKQPRDLSKTNIFYDIVRTYKTRIGIIEDTKTVVEKGCRVFPKPIARTDAELWLARKKAEYNPFLSKRIIDPRLTMEDRRMEYFSDHHRKWPGYDYFEFQYEVKNIRIEARETRDLLQDLRDVADGLTVVHAADQERAKAQAKQDAREKRAAAKSKRRDRSRKEFFDQHWQDERYNSAFRSWFGTDEYNRLLQEKRADAAGIYAQTSIFDMM